MSSTFELSHGFLFAILVLGPVFPSILFSGDALIDSDVLEDVLVFIMEEVRVLDVRLPGDN